MIAGFTNFREEIFEECKFIFFLKVFQLWISKLVGNFHRATKNLHIAQNSKLLKMLKQSDEKGIYENSACDTTVKRPYFDTLFSENSVFL
jgi:hypothetical protein